MVFVTLCAERTKEVSVLLHLRHQGHIFVINDQASFIAWAMEVQFENDGTGLNIA